MKLSRSAFPIACTLAALSATSASAQRSSAPAANAARAQRDDSTVVLVSRREMRVVFPPFQPVAAPDAPIPASRSRDYSWEISLETSDGPRTLHAWVTAADAAKLPDRSAESLVKVARPDESKPGMIVVIPAKAIPMRVSASRGRVTLQLTDSAMIARLFGMRPDSVRVRSRQPGDEWSEGPSVAVRYVAPQLPIPDAAMRAEAVRLRRKYEASIRSQRRYISGGEDFQDLWLASGDSLALHIEQLDCVFDSCISGRSTADSSWSIDDRSVAVLRNPPGIRHSAFGEPVRQWLHATKPGITTVRVHMLATRDDTADGRTPQRDIERRLVVTRAISSVRFGARTASAAVGELLPYTVAVTDTTGAAVRELAVRVHVLDGASPRISFTRDHDQLMFDAPGVVHVEARVGTHTDTMTVTVRDTAHTARPLILVVHGRGLLGRDSTEVRREAWLAIRKSMFDLNEGPVPMLDESDVRLVWYADVLDSHFDDSAATCAAASRADSTAHEDDINPVTLIAGLFGSLMDAASGEATGSDALELRGFAGDLRYLSHPATRCAAESRLHAQLRRAAREGRPVILVSHSLGALVSWSELSHATADTDRAPVSRWITIGSPLASNDLRQLIFGDARTSITTPARVGRWTNIVSPDDPVAVRLPTDSTSGIADLLTEQSHAEPHQMVSYLSDPATARAVSEAWQASRGKAPR